MVLLSSSSSRTIITTTRIPIAAAGGRKTSSSLALADEDFEWKDEWDSSNNDNINHNTWTSFAPSPEKEEGKDDNDDDDDDDDDDISARNHNNSKNPPQQQGEDEVDDSEAWLDVIASISVEELEFNAKENERADKVRQMQEWGFDDATVKNSFGVEIDDSKETKDEVDRGMNEYRHSIEDWGVDDDEDLTLVESHTKVEFDEETKEPVRQQMVYVDEHACIGCYNCAVVAQSTFFMEEEHGRARVFEQWGDDDETIAIAIDTCPVDCIHYVPYEELVALELDRRGQNINFKARLVNQGASGHMVTMGNGQAYSAPQKISGNFGVIDGENPEFEKKEELRKGKKERNKLLQQRKDQNKVIDL